MLLEWLCRGHAMKLTAIDIQQAKAVLQTEGWLSCCPRPFAEAVLARSQWMTVEVDSPIARGGEAEGGMFGVAQGAVGIIPAIAAADAGLIHIATAPFWFGLQPFVDGTGRQITVLARKKCTVAHLTTATLGEILDRHPEGWRMLLLQVTELTALAVQGVSDLLLTDRHRRCGAALLRLASARNAGCVPREIHCTHDELGAMCNLSRVSVHGVLRQFEVQRMIELGYRVIRIIDIDRLRQFVDAS